MKYFKPRCAACIALLLVTGCKKNDGNSTVVKPDVPLAKAPANFRVVGYLLAEDVESGAANSFDMSRINYLNITFSNADADGKLPAVDHLDAIIAKAHNNHVKVLASIGNSSTPAKYLATENNRTSYIAAIISSVNAHQLDGIDVDLEGDRIDSHYETFVGELSAALKAKGKLLTAAVATWETDWFTDKALSYFDILNVMSYDDTGPWDPSDPGPHSPYSMAAFDLDYWTNTRHIAKKKLNLGVPFYGYAFSNTSVDTYDYANIVSKFSGSENHDEYAIAKGDTLYYNGIPTISKKTKLAMQSAGGVMIWELMYDTDDENSLLNAIDKTANNNN